MGRRRTRLNWVYDHERQEFATPSGRILTLMALASLERDARECRLDLAGPWAGWKLRGSRLCPPGWRPGRPCITPHAATLFLHWLTECERADLAHDSTQRPIRDAPRTPHRRSDRTQLRVHRAAHLDDIPANALHVVSELVAGALDRLLRSS